MLVVCLMALTACAQKRIAILGDSYSTYQGFVEPDTNEMWYFEPARLEMTDVTDVKQTWWWLVCKEGGYLLEKNNSYSGSTISYTGYRGEDYQPRSFITRATNLGSPDIILVFGGTNDSWAGAPIGQMQWEGWTHQDLHSYRPAVCRLGQLLHDRYPNAKVYFMLNTELKAEIGEAMQQVCQRYGFTLIPLADIGKQHGHPNIQGMRSIATQVLEVIGDRL